jgi:hypothetical protein
MNRKRPENRQFVIEDLDATHLLIKTDEEESMREELEAEARLLLDFPSSMLLRRVTARKEYIQPRLVVHLLRLRPHQKLAHLRLDISCTQAIKLDVLFYPSFWVIYLAITQIFELRNTNRIEQTHVLACHAPRESSQGDQDCVS